MIHRSKNYALIAVIFSLLMTLFVFGCGDDSVKPDPVDVESTIVGNWKLVKEDGNNYTGAGKYFYFQSTGIFKAVDFDSEIYGEGTYTVDGSEIVISIPGILQSSATVSFSNNNNTMTTIDSDGSEEWHRDSNMPDYDSYLTNLVKTILMGNWKLSTENGTPVGYDAYLYFLTNEILQFIAYDGTTLLCGEGIFSVNRDEVTLTIEGIVSDTSTIAFSNQNNVMTLTNAGDVEKYTRDFNAPNFSDTCE